MGDGTSAELREALQVLRQQVAGYRRLLSLAQQQTRLITRRDLAGLEETSRRQEEALLELRELSPRLRRVLAEDPALLAPELRDLRQALRETALALRRTNRLNAELLRNGLEYTRCFLTALSRLSAGCSAYTRAGSIQTTSAPVAVSGLA